MILTEDQLKQLEEFGALLFSINKIAIILGVDVEELREMVTNDRELAFTFYNRGRLLSESEVRASVLKLAKQGSSPAQTLAKKYFDECEIENLKL